MADKKAFGEQTPTGGEDAISWQTWSDGAGSVPTISGDQDWGKLALDSIDDEARSAVYDMGSAVLRTLTMNKNVYGTGDTEPILYIRGSITSFLQDDAVPVWEEYAAPISRIWRYIQAGATTSSLFDQQSGTIAEEA